LSVDCCVRSEAIPWYKVAISSFMRQRNQGRAAMLVRKLQQCHAITVQHNGVAYNELQGAAIAAQGRGDTAEAVRLLRRMLELIPGDESTAYNLACCFAVTGDSGRALEWLANAVQWGFHHAAHARSDTDLASLHHMPEFGRLLALMDASAAAAAAPQVAAAPPVTVDPAAMQAAMMQAAMMQGGGGQAAMMQAAMMQAMMQGGGGGGGQAAMMQAAMMQAAMMQGGGGVPGGMPGQVMMMPGQAMPGQVMMMPGQAMPGQVMMVPGNSGAASQADLVAMLQSMGLAQAQAHVVTGSSGEGGPPVLVAAAPSSSGPTSPGAAAPTPAGAAVALRSVSASPPAAPSPSPSSPAGASSAVTSPVATGTGGVTVTLLPPPPSPAVAVAGSPPAVVSSSSSSPPPASSPSASVFAPRSLDESVLRARITSVSSSDVAGKTVTLYDILVETGGTPCAVCA
jgi:hypothetical protein